MLYSKAAVDYNENRLFLECSQPLRSLPDGVLGDSLRERFDKTTQELVLYIFIYIGAPWSLWNVYIIYEYVQERVLIGSMSIRIHHACQIVEPRGNYISVHTWIRVD